MRSFVNRRRTQRGFTIVELMVSMLLGLLVTSMAMSSALVNREVIKKDTMRTRINENLRASIDIIGADLRIAGENLGATFPAVELKNGASGAPDTLILRRNLLAEALPLCTAITAGTGVTNIFFAIPGTIPGCVYSGQQHSFNAWKAYRTADPDAVVDAYIYDTATKKGEFFQYKGENDNGNSYSIQRNAGNWANSYQTASSAIYILEEWRYSVTNSTMTLVQNADTANPLNVAFDVNNFQGRVLMQDGSTKTAFANTDTWTSIKSIELTITGQDVFKGSSMLRTITSRYFPRNVLSH